MGREKPLPRLPVAEDLQPETVVPADGGTDGTTAGGDEGTGGGGDAGPTARDAIEG